MAEHIGSCTSKNEFPHPGMAISSHHQEIGLQLHRFFLQRFTDWSVVAMDRMSFRFYARVSKVSNSRLPGDAAVSVATMADRTRGALTAVKPRK